jgi:hypothetical protein
MDIYLEISQIKKAQEETLAILKDLHNNGVVDNKEKVYDLTDLEKILHVSRRTIFKWKSEEKMNFSQIGKKVYVTDSELKRFLETNKKD